MHPAQTSRPEALPEGGPERRAALTAQTMAATGLDEAVIEGFVRAFYDRARRDEAIGRLFDGVADWDHHVAQISRFWSSVALMTGSYRGQPMQAHAHLPLRPAHFARWLTLFEAVAHERLPEAGAAHMIERARRIARSLEMGLIPMDLPGRTNP